MSKRAIAVLVACFFTIFTNYAIRYGYGVFLPEMLPALAISNTEAGMIYSSYFIVYTVASPFLGLLGDRYDTRIILTIFVAILGAGTLLMAGSSSVAEASLYFAIAGFGSSACWAPAMALAGRWVGQRRRGTTLAIIDAGSSLGIVFTGSVVPLIVMAYSWTTGWLSLGMLGFLVAALNYIMVRNSPEARRDPTPAPPGKYAGEPLGKIYGMLLRDYRFWLIGLAYLFTGFSIIIPFTFLSTYAVRELALPYDAATRMITVVGASALAGKLILGPLSDRVGRIRIMMLCALLITGGSLGMAAASDVIVLALFTAVFGFGYGTVWSMYAAAASDYFSRSIAGSIIGFWTVYLGVGSLVSPIIAGWIADTTGTLVGAFLLAMAGGAASLLLLVPVWRQRNLLAAGNER